MSNADKKKILKKLGKKCPECEGVLSVVIRTKENDGVEYSEKRIECLDCDYHEKISNKHKKRLD